MGRGQAHLAKGEMNLAFSDFDSGVYDEPLTYDPYIARAEAYFKAGQQDRAAADLDKAIRIAPTPDQPGAYHTRCLYFIRIGKPQDGLADCNKSLTLRPMDVQTLVPAESLT
jgi:Tfp pilus assembly protein PilF